MSKQRPARCRPGPKPTGHNPTALIRIDRCDADRLKSIAKTRKSTVIDLLRGVFLDFFPTQK